MIRYLFDTNILLLFLRQDKRWDIIFLDFKLGDSLNLISIVSMGELHSLALQNNWGNKRHSQIEQLRNDFIITDINVEELVQQYAQIDAFSQDKLQDKPLGNSSRNMGKNDLWIAATAAVFNLKLLTTDPDFDHLNHVFIDIARVAF